MVLLSRIYVLRPNKFKIFTEKKPNSGTKQNKVLNLFAQIFYRLKLLNNAYLSYLYLNHQIEYFINLWTVILWSCLLCVWTNPQLEYINKQTHSPKQTNFRAGMPTSGFARRRGVFNSIWFWHFFSWLYLCKTYRNIYKNMYIYYRIQTVWQYSLQITLLWLSGLTSLFCIL